MTVRRLRDAWDVLAGRKVAVEPLRGIVTYTMSPSAYVHGGMVYSSFVPSDGGWIVNP